MFNKYDNRVPFQTRLNAGIKRSKTCWEWIGHTRGTGRGVIHYKGKQRYVYRVVWEIANGEIPEGMYVCHKCDNPKCVRLSHLFVGTPTDNARDCKEKGRLAPPELTKQLGERNGGGKKLTGDDVLNLRKEFNKTGYRRGIYSRLSQKYKVSTTMIKNVVLRKNWTHI